MVIWSTGLSGVGKSTIAARLLQQLKTRGDATALLDGLRCDAVEPRFTGTGCRPSAGIRDRPVLSTLVWSLLWLRSTRGDR